MLNHSEYLITKLGKPLDNTSNLARFYSPFRLEIAWIPGTYINSFLVHPIIFDPITNVFNELLDCYGPGLIEELNINQYGGCYNNRLKRGAKSYTPKNISSHAWAIAIDLDPVNNKLRWNHKKAHFARPEYNDMMEIFYKNGFYNLGREKNFDYMHFEYLVK